MIAIPKKNERFTKKREKEKFLSFLHNKYFVSRAKEVLQIIIEVFDDSGRKEAGGKYVLQIDAMMNKKNKIKNKKTDDLALESHRS